MRGQQAAVLPQLHSLLTRSTSAAASSLGENARDEISRLAAARTAGQGLVLEKPVFGVDKVREEQRRSGNRRHHD
jgi:hypothetical protein